MKAVLFWPRTGSATVEDIPAPNLGPGQVLIATQCSLISAGTERARVETGRQGLIGKARSRPDQVAQVMASARQVGIPETVKMVNDRLDQPSLVGYAAAGTVLEVGAGVTDFAPGMRVAAGGAGYANHAERIVVPRNLVVPVPDEVPFEAAAFTTVGAIALQGIHQAGVQPGSRVAVIGLGLVGQLTVRLLHAYGCDVVGVDRDPAMLNLSRTIGVPAVQATGDGVAREVKAAWGGEGADAVVITAASRSAEPVTLAGALARDRATVVVVGDVKADLPRKPYYGKELTLTYSRSYGPGRYDPAYEEGGIDYPAGYVPWTERRNMAEVVRLLAKGALEVGTLEPVSFVVDEAAAAYELLKTKGPERRVAILLDYEQAEAVPSGPIRLPAPPRPRPQREGRVRVAAVGAGSFPSRMLLPHLGRMDDVRFTWITSGRGLTAWRQGRRHGFDLAVDGLRDGLALGDADCVMVLSRHDSHAAYSAQVLRAGLGLFCEKPLALTGEELEMVAEAWQDGGGPAMVGFNRRFAPATQELAAMLDRGSPMQVSCRVFAGKLAPGHWSVESEQGGRVLGEVCHFVDLAGWLIGAVPVRVFARHAEPREGPAAGGPAQSVSALIEYADGSSATITYGGRTPPGAPKELIEVASDGLAARIEDWRTLKTWPGPRRGRTYRGQAKGHREEMRGLVDLVQGRATESWLAEAADFRSALWSTLTTIALGRAAAGDGVAHVEPEGPSLRKALGIDLSTVRAT
jgi:predicted dehydrogenase/threonine dehydrogenase-like Zn-dependent dehydrogenase